MSPTELPVPNTAATSTRTATVEFSGQKGEYAKLWLVNLLLSIITLGIYSAWAKVRNNQYLYGHTQIEGHRFQYLAQPMQILRGRIIAVLVFVAYSLASSFNPALAAVMMLALIALFPWLIIQGLKFTLRNSAYRGVRFSFEASYWAIVGYFFLLPVLGMVTFGLAMPWVAQKTQKYLYENATYGGKPFSVPTSAAEYYKAVLMCLGAVVLLMAAIFVIVFTFSMTSVLIGDASNPLTQKGMSGAGMVIGAPVYFFAIYLLSAIYQGLIRNHLFNCLHINGVFHAHSAIRILPFAVLMMSNALLLICTLGLAFPVTVVRKQRFLAAATSFTLEPGIDHLVNTVPETHSAFGEEAAGLFDADLSLT